MAETSKTKGPARLSDPEKYPLAGPGGATRRTGEAPRGSLTTNQAVVIADNQNAMKSEERGPSLLKDFVFRKKITHFDHRRIRVNAMRDTLEELAIVAPKIGRARPKSGKRLSADMALSGAPSCFFDAVAIFASADGITPLRKNSAATDWVRGGFRTSKVMGPTPAAQPLFAKAGIADDLDGGVIELDACAGIGRYIEAAKQQRVWDRKSRLSVGEA